MMTPDKDFAQLVSSNVFLYKPAFMGRGVDILGEKEVINKC
jgi:DNA polymerase-1